MKYKIKDEFRYFMSSGLDFTLRGELENRIVHKGSFVFKMNTRMNYRLREILLYRYSLRMQR